MTLEEARKKLTPREFEFLEAMLAKDDSRLRSFGDDAVILAKSVEYKILEAGGIDAGPSKVEAAGTQLTLFEVAGPEPEPEPPLPVEESSKEEFTERAKPIVIPGVPGTGSVVPTEGNLDGMERLVSKRPDLGELNRKPDILDSSTTGYTKPFSKGDIVAGDRVMFKATGAIHRVKGVDRTTDPHTVKLSVFGKIMEVSREMVSKIAPRGYDPRWHRRRVRQESRYKQPGRYADTTTRDGHDPSDRSS